MTFPTGLQVPCICNSATRACSTCKQEKGQEKLKIYKQKTETHKSYREV